MMTQNDLKDGGGEFQNELVLKWAVPLLITIFVGNLEELITEIISLLEECLLSGVVLQNFLVQVGY